MSKKLRTDAVDHLFDAILSLQNREECYTFFEDVCTVNELLSLSQRFEVAKMLRDQKTYLDIAEKTGASTATISRVNRSLNYGNDGYDMVFSLHAEYGQAVETDKKKPQENGNFCPCLWLFRLFFVFFRLGLVRCGRVDQTLDDGLFHIDIVA